MSILLICCCSLNHLGSQKSSIRGYEFSSGLGFFQRALSLAERYVKESRCFFSSKPGMKSDNRAPYLSIPEKGSIDEQFRIWEMETSKAYWKRELEEIKKARAAAEQTLPQILKQVCKEINEIKEKGDHGQTVVLKTELDKISSLLNKALQLTENRH